MSALKYVCLSDLHLGADYSVLTQMDDQGKTTLLEPSAALSAFGRALRTYVSALSGDQPPALILLGDALDMGLSPAGAVAQAFKRFIEALFPRGEPEVFSKQVLCVPGNHDHHLWRAAQDRYFVERMEKYARGEDAEQSHFIPDLLQHTSLFEPMKVRCELMTRVMRVYPHLGDAEVNVAYPNFGLIDKTRKKCIVLHHGHFLDSVYRAMSTLNVKLNGAGRGPKTVAQIEGQNGAWIDFLWSGLGSGGDVARDATSLYETTRNPLASHELAQKLSNGLLAELSKRLGVGASTEITRGITVSNVVKGAVDLVLLRWAESERDSYYSIMSPDGVADLRWYLEGPLRAQLEEARKYWDQEIDCRDLSFVFGHTHKPFQQELAATGYSQPVAIYNTGGWVMDQPTMAPTQGAAAVFIDDALRVASLRLFNDPVNGVFAPVRAIGVGGYRDADNALLERMRAALSGAPWGEFSEKVAAALEVHARVLLKKSGALELSA